MSTPRISVIGSGYVGLITGILFSTKGFETVCIDVIQETIDKINQGISPFYEPGLDELLEESLSSRRFFASMDRLNEIGDSDISFICVGTPSQLDGSADLSYIKSAARDIGLAIKDSKKYHVI